MSAETDGIKSSISRLALTAGRKMRISSIEEKINLTAAIGLLNIASSVVDADTGMARTLYSQARQLIALQGQNDDGQI